MKTVIASVVYEKAIGYLEEFLQSVSRQTTEKFDILLLSDDIQEKYLRSLVGGFFRGREQEVIILKAYGKQTVGQLRVQLIREAKLRGYGFIIFSDCDDKLSMNRVECYMKGFNNNYSFYYNDLVDFDGQVIMPYIPLETLSWRQIEEKNYLGMSNTGIFLEHFSLDFIDSLERGNTKIFDWYLYSRILLLGAKGKKVDGCCTYYRIYDGNTAGKTVLTEEQVEKEIKVKIEHYGLLELENMYFGDLKKEYESYYERVQTLNLENTNKFWWGLIKRQNQ